MLRIVFALTTLSMALEASAAWAQPAGAQPEGVIQGAERRQDFYPIGAASAERMKIDYYLLGGPLSVTGRPILRAAVLVNNSDEARGTIQLVEIMSINCATHEAWPTFRIVYGAGGRLLSSTGPTDGPDDAGTMLTPDAVRRASDILCSGKFPETALRKRTLADFRDKPSPQ